MIFTICAVGEILYRKGKALLILIPAGDIINSIAYKLDI